MRDTDCSMPGVGKNVFPIIHDHSQVISISEICSK